MRQELQISVDLVGGTTSRNRDGQGSSISTFQNVSGSAGSIPRRPGSVKLV